MHEKVLHLLFVRRIGRFLRLIPLALIYCRNIYADKSWSLFSPKVIGANLTKLDCIEPKSKDVGDNCDQHETPRTSHSDEN